MICSLRGVVETFGNADGLGFADEGEAGREAPEAALALKIAGEVLAAVVVAQFDAAGAPAPLAPKTCVSAWATGS